MKGYVTNIESDALENESFRRVVYTAKHCQLVLMSLSAGEEIGEEVHDVDQFIRCETGSGTALLNGVRHEVADGTVLLIPAGTRHNVTNTAQRPMKLYTLYAPPHHRDGVTHVTKVEAEKDEEHFDGVTTETI